MKNQYYNAKTSIDAPPVRQVKISVALLTTSAAEIFNNGQLPLLSTTTCEHTEYGRTIFFPFKESYQAGNGAKIEGVAIKRQRKGESLGVLLGSA